MYIQQDTHSEKVMKIVITVAFILITRPLFMNSFYRGLCNLEQPSHVIYNLREHPYYCTALSILGLLNIAPAVLSIILCVTKSFRSNALKNFYLTWCIILVLCVFFGLSTYLKLAQRMGISETIQGLLLILYLIVFGVFIGLLIVSWMKPKLPPPPIIGGVV